MSRMKSVIVGAAALLISTAPFGVSAQDEDEAEDADARAELRGSSTGPVDGAADLPPGARGGFGAAGQWAFSSDAALALQRATQSDTDGATTSVILAPAADYFIIRNLSVGGTIALSYTKAGESTSTRFGLGPRVGYNIPLSELLSVWPKLGFSYAHTSSKTEATVAGMQVSQESDSNGIALNLFAPIMVHPAPHFFAGFGPFLDTDLSGDNRSTVWGVKLTLGGWL